MIEPTVPNRVTIPLTGEVSWLTRVNLFLVLIFGLVAGWGFFFSEQALLAITLLELTILILTIGWLVCAQQDIINTLGLKKISLVQVGISIVIFGAGIHLASYLDEVFRFFILQYGNLPAADIPRPRNGGEFFVYLIPVALMPALAEEALFRGLVLKNYQRYFGAGGSIIISAVLFGMAHLDITNLIGPLVLGLVAGWLVWSYQSIIPAVIGHFLNNSLALLANYISPSLPTVVSLNNLWEDLPPFVIAALILGLFLIILPIKNERTCLEASALPRLFRNWPFWLLILFYGFIAVMEFLVLSGKL